MKFKKGDRVKVVSKDEYWRSWMPDMDRMVGSTCDVVGIGQLCEGYYPMIEIPGGLQGMRTNLSYYCFPEHCLELAVKPGEQLLFSFMEEDNG